MVDRFSCASVLKLRTVDAVKAARTFWSIEKRLAIFGEAEHGCELGGRVLYLSLFAPVLIPTKPAFAAVQPKGFTRALRFAKARMI
jgi:hypothetical protein